MWPPQGRSCHAAIVCFLWYLTARRLMSPNKYILYCIKIFTTERNKSSSWIFTVLRNILSGILFLQISTWFQPLLHSTFCSNYAFTGRPFLTTFSKITLPTPSFYFACCTFFFFIAITESWHITCVLTCLLLFLPIKTHASWGRELCFIPCDILVSPFMLGTK